MFGTILNKGKAIEIMNPENEKIRVQQMGSEK
jgi:hypothetical protein